MDHCCDGSTENGDARNDHHDDRGGAHDTTSCPDSSTAECLPCAGSSPSSAYSFSECSRYRAESFRHGISVRRNAMTINAMTMPQPNVLTYQFGKPPYGSSAVSKATSSLIKV